MLPRDKIAIYFTILTIIFVLMGFFLISNSEESVTAAAVSQLSRIKIGSESQSEIITEEILLKEDIGQGTTSTTISPTQTSQSTSTIISTQSSVLTTSILTTSTTSIATTSILGEQQTIHTFIPKSAKDNYGKDQMSPDDGDLDGTVDVSNDDTRWLTINGEYIEVEDWDNDIEENPFIVSAIVNCEVQFVNPKSGFIEFSYNSGPGWSPWLCSQEATQLTTFSCDLKQHGLDSANKINNVEIRCKLRNNEQGAIGFSIDSINLVVTTQ